MEQVYAQDGKDQEYFVHIIVKFDVKWAVGLNLWIGKIPWRRDWQCTPIFLPGKSHGQRRLVGYGPWGHKSWAQLSDRACTGSWVPMSGVQPRCACTYVCMNINEYLHMIFKLSFNLRNIYVE